MTVFGSVGTTELAAVLSTVVLNSFAQILLRFGLRDQDIALYVTERQIGALASLALRPAVIGGVACFAVGLLFWVFVISRLPASVAYPMMSLAYVTVLLLGWVLLDEHITPVRLIGVGIIVVGVGTIARSA